MRLVEETQGQALDMLEDSQPHVVHGALADAHRDRRRARAQRHRPALVIYERVTSKDARDLPGRVIVSDHAAAAFDGGRGFLLRARLAYNAPRMPGTLVDLLKARAANSPDQRYDTLTSMQRSGGGNVWELAVPNGTYTLEAVSTFNETINDGIADYAAGDYIFVYNVTVEK